MGITITRNFFAQTNCFSWRDVIAFIQNIILLLFQLYHGFSHMKHTNDDIQTNTIHYLSYFVNFTLFLTVKPGTIKSLLLLFLFLVDIFIGSPKNVITQAIIFLLLLPFDYTLLILMGVTSLLLVNEHYNCDKIKHLNPHVLVEICGTLLFLKASLLVDGL